MHQVAVQVVKHLRTTPISKLVLRNNYKRIERNMQDTHTRALSTLSLSLSLSLSTLAQELVGRLTRLLQ